LILNADASAGKIEVEVVDEHLRPIPGFTRAESTPVRADGASQVCGWAKHSDLSSLSARAVRLRFFMRKADLYAFELK